MEARNFIAYYGNPNFQKQKIAFDAFLQNCNGRIKNSYLSHAFREAVRECIAKNITLLVSDLDYIGIEHFDFLSDTLAKSPLRIAVGKVQEEADARNEMQLFMLKLEISHNIKISKN